MEDLHRCYHEADIAELKTNVKAAFHRIDELRGIYGVLTSQSESIHELAINMTKLTERMDTTTNTIGAIQTDINEIKKVPVEDYRYYKRSWITGVIGIITGAILTALLSGVIQ